MRESETAKQYTISIQAEKVRKSESTEYQYREAEKKETEKK